MQKIEYPIKECNDFVLEIEEIISQYFPQEYQGDLPFQTLLEQQQIGFIHEFCITYSLIDWDTLDFDSIEFIPKLELSVSLHIFEKLRVSSNALKSLSLFQMNEIYKIFMEEREKFKIAAKEYPNQILDLIFKQFSFRPDLINFAYNLYFQHYSEIELKMIQNIDREDKESQYLTMIKLSKTNQELASNLDSYADFLADNLQDYPKAQEMYERAIEADPKHANTLGNYALFLKNNLQDYPKAQEMYERAIEANPKHTNTLGNYANLLADNLQDYPKAQEMYERAIEADPKHANTLGNYAKFLFLMSDYNKGIELLEKAESDKELHPDLAVELAFYRYAHVSPYDLEPLKKLLLNGARSIDWDLSANVEKAMEDKHPHGDMIATIANVISGEEPIEILNKFLKWNEE